LPVFFHQGGCLVLREGEAGTNRQDKQQNCGDEEVVTERSMRNSIHRKNLLEAKLDGGLNRSSDLPAQGGSKKTNLAAPAILIWEAPGTCQGKVSDL